jgi:hypothetical protein
MWRVSEGAFDQASNRYKNYIDVFEHVPLLDRVVLYYSSSGRSNLRCLMNWRGTSEKLVTAIVGAARGQRCAPSVMEIKPVNGEQWNSRVAVSFLGFPFRGLI